ncbi:MAG TPA: hypothetical protein PKV16_04710 [Caldisericia bacterium]|nr:hypothetical protein [Caldisericia bacterium]HPF48612.1 hypothetical protein [Caldisericia bacterium]HPI83728.1 hypothetical protein [Caldisericia bacterium]HPQ93067.1 hypothetical protein [Caldisericia bacterium]HRV75100.1 hypothetical protein [Caldisericia bacterium]
MLSSFGISSEIEGVKHKLDSLKNVSKALVESANTVSSEIDANFKAGGRPRWSGDKTLIETGALRKTATSVSVSGNTALVGAKLSDIPYARVHQHGGKHIPARPYMTLPTSWKETATRVFGETLFGGAR